MGVESILIVGARSYVGAGIHRFLETSGFHVVAATSSNCNLLDRQSIRAFSDQLPRARYDVLFVASVTKPAGDSFDGFRGNVTMLQQWVEGMDWSLVRSLIYISSVDIYGTPVTLPITEHTTTTPDNWYGLAKRDCEWILGRHADMVPVTILRIPGIYGPGPGDRSVVKRLVDSAISGCLTIFGDGSTRRDYVFLPDLARLVSALLARPAACTLNVASGDNHSILEVVETIQAMVLSAFDVVHTSPEHPLFDLVFDTTLFESHLPNFSFTPLNIGIQTYLPHPGTKHIA